MGQVSGASQAEPRPRERLRHRHPHGRRLRLYPYWDPATGSGVSGRPCENASAGVTQPAEVLPRLRAGRIEDRPHGALLELEVKVDAYEVVLLVDLVERRSNVGATDRRLHDHDCGLPFATGVRGLENGCPRTPELVSSRHRPAILKSGRATRRWWRIHRWCHVLTSSCFAHKDTDQDAIVRRGNTEGQRAGRAQ